jgi:energy-coupling factor transporter ATP-binding protein EcfA2
MARRARWHVESVRARAFKAFQEEVEVKLPSSRLVCLVGANGSGKSCLLEALCLCLAPGCAPSTLRARELKELVCTESAEVGLVSLRVARGGVGSRSQFCQSAPPPIILPRPAQLFEVRVRIFDGVSTRHEVLAGLAPAGTRVYKLDGKLTTATALRVCVLSARAARFFVGFLGV